MRTGATVAHRRPIPGAGMSEKNRPAPSMPTPAPPFGLSRVGPGKPDGRGLEGWRSRVKPGMRGLGARDEGGSRPDQGRYIRTRMGRNGRADTDGRLWCPGGGETAVRTRNGRLWCSGGEETAAGTHHCTYGVCTRYRPSSGKTMYIPLVKGAETGVWREVRTKKPAWSEGFVYIRGMCGAE